MRTRSCDRSRKSTPMHLLIQVHCRLLSTVSMVWDRLVILSGFLHQLQVFHQSSCDYQQAQKAFRDEGGHAAVDDHLSYVEITRSYPVGYEVPKEAQIEQAVKKKVPIAMHSGEALLTGFDVV